ncbi:MAG: hypothetical protein CV087_09020 [Candidatus Brocadia sp. WS118]|nr:MAG: hypothetical protein CV087_09020 [Candidatus Brocadia sp. WS118]
MKILEYIHRGGFGRVDKVQLDNGDIAAMKTFEPSMTIQNDAEFEKLKRRFVREVKIQSLLPSDHFITIIASDLDGAKPYYVMPLAEKSLATGIKSLHDEKKIQQIISDILSALEILHSLGYTHRDLKPANVLYHDGKWKLSDFGLALPPVDSTTKITSVDSNWGSEGYCAPEQVLEFRNVSYQADIYSFGCILHDIYSKEPRIPYQRYTAKGEIGLIIEKCTEVDLSKRFKDVQTLRVVLYNLFSGVKVNNVSQPLQIWLDKLKSINEWNRDDFKNLITVLIESDEDDKMKLYSELGEPQLIELNQLDPELWEFLAIKYCKWTDQGFTFNFCDILIHRLERIFLLGSLDCKAAAAIAAAKLGANHNRWYVMRKLVDMLGPHLDNYTAQRIAIEIAVEKAGYEFDQCVEMIGQDINSYHPIIAKQLSPQNSH